MKFPKTVDNLYLSNLSQQIQILPSDEASALLFEGSALILLAGYIDIAYQLFLKLIQGELAICDESVLANPLKLIIPGLCHSLDISCPTFLSIKELSLNNNIVDSKIKFRARKRFELFGFLTDLYIYKWWNTSNSLISVLYYFGHFPNAIMRLETGILRDYIIITPEQAQDFLDSVNQRKQETKMVTFIPTVEDWRFFLDKWDKEIFENLDSSYIENYQSWFPEVIKRKSCLNQGATEEEINILQEKIQTKLPLSYKNFLLASNGFTILNEYNELYGTNEIKWFIEENREVAEIWDDWNDEDITDEEYFLYGQHQNCGSIRGRYMKTALQISLNEDGYVYLLNPLIIDSRNEWEAWDFGTKLPGAYRYRSFWDMMQELYKRCFD